jgi:hypothetical protein
LRRTQGGPVSFKGSYQVPLTNLEVGSKLNKVTFLIDSRAGCSSLAFHPPGLQLSDKLLVSKVKGDRFNVSLFKETPEKYKDR